jgi:hypothetical protein
MNGQNSILLSSCHVINILFVKVRASGHMPVEKLLTIQHGNV